MRKAFGLFALLASLVFGVPVRDSEPKPLLDEIQAVHVDRAILVDSDLDAWVGGFGKEEPFVAVNFPEPQPERPMAALVQEDEGLGCVDCNHPSIPEGFSGDLNELAEEAYAPTPEQLHAAMAEMKTEEYDDRHALKYSMKPGDVMIGGYGIVERNVVPEENDDDNDVVNLEVEEGADLEPPVRDVDHQIVVLRRDIEAKQQEVAGLRSELEKLRESNSDFVENLKRFDADAQEAVSKTKSAAEEAIREEEASYDKMLEEIRRDSKDKAARLRLEEQHIELRKSVADSAQITGEQQNLQTELVHAERELDDIRRQADEAEARERDALRREHLWDTPVSDLDNEGLRARLAAAKLAAEEARNEAEKEDSLTRQLDMRLREEQKAKEVLNSRLQNLHLREQAVRDKEHEMEAINANLRHELDEHEVHADETAEELARTAEEARRRAASVADEVGVAVADQEREFEIQAVHSAQDEVRRLKEELERRERREAHAEHELLQQTAEAHKTQETADAIEAEVEEKLASTRAEIAAKLEEAKAEANEIVVAAEITARALKEVSQSEGFEDSRVTIRSQETANKEQAAALAREEEHAKQLSSELRRRVEAKMAEDEARIRKELEDARNAMRARLQSVADADLAKVREAAETKLGDVGADWMAAKIRADKDQQLLADLKAQHDKLARDVSHLKEELARQREEWELQQIAQENPILPFEPMNH